MQVMKAKDKRNKKGEKGDKDYKKMILREVWLCFGITKQNCCLGKRRYQTNVDGYILFLRLGVRVWRLSCECKEVTQTHSPACSFTAFFDFRVPVHKPVLSINEFNNYSCLFFSGEYLLLWFFLGLLLVIPYFCKAHGNLLLVEFILKGAAISWRVGWSSSSQLQQIF